MEAKEIIGHSSYKQNNNHEKYAAMGLNGLFDVVQTLHSLSQLKNLQVAKI